MFPTRKICCTALAILILFLVLLPSRIVLGDRETQASSIPLKSTPAAQEWVIEKGFPQKTSIRSCDFLSPSEGWSVGEDQDDTYVFYWNGNTWLRSPIATKSFGGLRAIQVLASNNIWIAGSSGTLLHGDGNHWKDYSDQINDDLHSLSFLSDDFGMAAGGQIDFFTL